jgi:hypothetical protein
MKHDAAARFRYITAAKKAQLTDLTPAAQVLLWQLAAYADRDGSSFVKPETIMRCSGLSRRTMTRAQRQLRKTGILARSRLTGDPVWLIDLEALQKLDPELRKEVPIAGPTIADVIDFAAVQLAGGPMVVEVEVPKDTADFVKSSIQSRLGDTKLEFQDADATQDGCVAFKVWVA